MGSLITFGPEDKPLELFSLPHLAAIAAVIFSCALLMIFKNKFLDEKYKLRFKYITAIIITVQLILLYVWYFASGEFMFSWALPIQLCDISVFLSILALILKRNEIIYEVLYFWGLGGATQAILTPDIGNFTFPHFLYYQFFLCHGLIVLTCLYIVFVEKFRPAIKSIFRTFIITNIYAAIIIPVNFITGGNYMFLRYKPQGGSLMELLGPWPWYILELEAVALVLFFILYLPFAFSGLKKSTHMDLPL